MEVAPNSSQISPWHHFPTAFTWARPILSTAREGWSQLPSAPRPLLQQDIPSSLSLTLGSSSPQLFFIVTGPSVHNSGSCFSASGSYLNLCFCSCPSSSLSSPLTSVSVNMNTKLLSLLFRSHHQFSQTLSFLQSRPSRFLVSHHITLLLDQREALPVHLQNS